MEMIVSAILSLSLVISILLAAFITDSNNGNSGLRSFKSLQEIEDFVKAKAFEKYLEYCFEGCWVKGPRLLLSSPEALAADSIVGVAEYSTTNTQVFQKNIALANLLKSPIKS